MGEHLVLCVDRLITPESLQSLQVAEAAPGSSGESSGSHPADPPTCSIDVEGVEEHGMSEEEEPLIQTVECRICQEEDSIKNLEIPCACNGSLKVFFLYNAFLSEFEIFKILKGSFSSCLLLILEFGNCFKGNIPISINTK